jgi:hypothetical protein
MHGTESVLLLGGLLVRLSVIAMKGIGVLLSLSGWKPRNRVMGCKMDKSIRTASTLQNMVHEDMISVN